MAIGITSPAAGSTLRGSIEIFSWDLEDVEVENSYLYVGSSRGSTQYAARNVFGINQLSLGRLPFDGSTVHLRLWYRSDGVWRFFDQEHPSASSPNLPTFVEPISGGTGSGETQTFRWNFGNLPVTDSWLYVGATVGGSDYAARRTGTETTTVVTGLPTDQSTVHARLYFKVIDAWYNVDSTFEAASVVPPNRDELTRELQSLVGATADGIVGPQTRAALNRNWLGRPGGFDPSFAERFVNDTDLVRWVQRRINTRTRGRLELTGVFDEVTESAVVGHLERSGVVAAESFVALLEPAEN